MTTQTFNLTAKQKQVRAVFATAAKYLLVYGGSRSGKTFFICYSILVRAIKAPGSRHAIFRRHGVAVKQSIGKDTLPKVVALAFPDLPIKWHEQDGYFSLGNGSEIWLAGLDDKERVDKVLGREFATLYFNEASEIPLTSYMVATTRLAQSVLQTDGRPLALKCYVDLNPTTAAHWTYQMWVLGIHPDGNRPIVGHAENYSHVVVNPVDNSENLPADYLRDLASLPERQRKRFFDGQFTADDDNALWRRAWIKVDQAPEMGRIVVSVDPATTNTVGSDETGLIVCGIGKDGRGYVLADESGKFRPEEWARRAISLADTYQADAIVAEVNQGGDMVEAVIRAESRGRIIPVRKVTATRAKHIRAEPIAAMYEQGKVRHADEFPQLVDQLCFVAGTLVETSRGCVPIEEVKVGDFALTRSGYRPIEVACKSGEAYSFVEIETEDGRKITCTGNHPIFTKDRFVPAENVRVGDILFARPLLGSMGSQSLGAASGITECKRGISGTQGGSSCIVQYGLPTLAKSPTGCISTISTKTPATIALKILHAFPRLSTILGTNLAGGTQPRSGDRKTERLLGEKENGTSRIVRIVTNLLKRHTQTGPSFAGAYAYSVRHRLQRLWSVNAPIAGTSFKHAIQGECIAVRAVTTRHTSPESVYNLRVEGLPEYFANGILVHNCAFTLGFDRGAQGYSPDRVDALVWGMTDLFPQMTRKEPPPRVAPIPMRMPMARR